MSEIYTDPQPKNIIKKHRPPLPDSERQSRCPCRPHYGFEYYRLPSTTVATDWNVMTNRIGLRGRSFFTRALLTARESVMFCSCARREIKARRKFDGLRNYQTFGFDCTFAKTLTHCPPMYSVASTFGLVSGSLIRVSLNTHFNDTLVKHKK